MSQDSLKLGNRKIALKTIESDQFNPYGNWEIFHVDVAYIEYDKYTEVTQNILTKRDDPYLIAMRKILIGKSMSLSQDSCKIFAPNIPFTSYSAGYQRDYINFRDQYTKYPKDENVDAKKDYEYNLGNRRYLMMQVMCLAGEKPEVEFSITVLNENTILINSKNCLSI